MNNRYELKCICGCYQVIILCESYMYLRVCLCTSWWIRANGADVVSSLTESVRGECSGDLDLADGALNKAHKMYQQ